MSRKSASLRAALRVRHTQGLIRGIRIAGYRMARAPRPELPCIEQIERILSCGATEQEQAAAAAGLARLPTDRQKGLLP